MLKISNITEFINKALNRVTSNKFNIILFLFAITLIFRLVTLFNKNISSDEATYLIIGRAIFNGKIYLVDLWDFKPIGIFLIFGFIQHFISDSILAMRILGLLVVFFSSILVYRISLLYVIKRETAIISGLFYILLLSFINPVFDLNTEIFFNFFTLLGFFFLLNSKFRLNIFFSGLFLGIGFMIKYVVVFDAVIIFLFYILGLYHKHFLKNIPVKILWTFLAVIGFVLPFALTHLYYWMINYLPEFYKATFDTSKVYAERINLKREILYFLDFNYCLLPIIILFYISIYQQIKEKGLFLFTGIFALSWFIADWIPTMMQGKHFSHYYIHLFVPVSIFSSLGFRNIKKQSYRLILLILFSLFISYSFYRQYKKVFYLGKDVEKVISYIGPKLEKDDIVFSNIQSVYYLLDKIPPTRYVHHSILTDNSHSQASGIDYKKEIDFVFNKPPAYIIIGGDSKNSYLMAKIKKDYVLDKVIDSRINIYKRSGEF